MKAVVLAQHGDADALKHIENHPNPSPGAKQVLVRVKACALNHLDIWVRQGIPGVRIPMPHILGCESAGVVEAIGKDVSGIGKGDRVLVAPGICCGECGACRAGWDSMCDEYKLMGYQVPGGYAEYVVCPAENILPVSERWSFEEWASAPLDFLTAWHMMMTRAKLKPQETVLVHAAGSGVGSAAIQLAKLHGARVITTASTDAKLAKGKELGADETINYKDKDFAKAVRKLTDGRGADVVVEHIGPDTWDKSMASLAKMGRLVTCGATSGPIVQMDLRFVFSRQLSVAGCYMGGRSELKAVMEHLRVGRVRPVVDKVYPLKEAADAHRRMLARENFGKIVLVP